MRQPQVKVARIYFSLRTAHLERFRQLEPSHVIYRHARYDFDSDIVDPAHPPRQMGRIGTVWHLLTHSYAVVEVNEPAIAWLWWDLLLEVGAVRLRALVMREDPRIVTYCIGIVDPADDARGHRYLPYPVVRGLTRPAMRVLAGSMDRVAFGTSGSYEMYARHISDRVLAQRAKSFEALPARCECLTEGSSTGSSPSILFVGAFDDRKGIRQLMCLWEALVQMRPGLSLKLIGKGRRCDEVRAWSAARAEVDLVIDPPRPEIHRAMRAASCVILLSQRVGGWREQVGLPIVEGLSHGCEVITTDETGLAGWLRDHGHLVVPVDLPLREVAAQVSARMGMIRSRESVLADLPSSDRRLEADRWMVAAATEARHGLASQRKRNWKRERAVW